MKKRLLVLGLAFTMFAATACGTSSDDGNKTSKADKTVTATPNSDKTSETQKNDDKKDDAKESYKSADDITMDDLKNHEETPGEDFKYRDKSNGEAVIKEYTGDDPIVVIPNEIDGKKVVDFGKTFTNNKDIIAIKIGDNIEEVAEGALTNCDNLKYIVFGKNVKVINDGLLGGSKIEQIEFNDGLEKLGSNVSGVGLKSKIDVSIPESVTEMTFRGAKTLIVKSGSYAESYAKEYADKLGMAYKVE
ncbi:MAG: leucine-rich repeat protein [Agathobacter sp.]|uniref:leucine-rich repeat protein n=2 Tax=Agathobacter sp. TaxID=2021311 RepID=UPI0039947DCC